MFKFKTPEGYSIKYDPKPIPIRSHDWEWSHESLDIDNLRCGTAGSYEECLRQIAEDKEAQHDEILLPKRA